MPAWIEGIKQRLNAATPGPWVWEGWKTDAGTRYQHIMAIGDHPYRGFGVADTYHMDAVRDYLDPKHGNHNNAEFIVHSPADITKLIQAVEYAVHMFDEIQKYRASDKAHDCISLAITAKAKLQSGEFPANMNDRMKRQKQLYENAYADGIASGEVAPYDELSPEEKAASSGRVNDE